MEQERAIASVLSKVDEVKFVEFVASVAGLFEQCFGLRSSKQNKHLRAIELERNFTECRSKTNPASKAWEDILLVLVLQAFLDTGLPRGNRHKNRTRRSHARCHPYPIPQPVKVGHTTGVYVPYSFRTVVRVLLRPTRIDQ